MIRKFLALSLTSTLVQSGCGTGLPTTTAVTTPTVTPTISAQVNKHVVVIFGENISFDHYFGTCPTAANPANDAVKFTAATGTPVPNNLVSVTVRVFR